MGPWKVSVVSKQAIFHIHDCWKHIFVPARKDPPSCRLSPTICHFCIKKADGILVAFRGPSLGSHHQWLLGKPWPPRSHLLKGNLKMSSSPPFRALVFWGRPQGPGKIFPCSDGVWLEQHIQKMIEIHKLDVSKNLNLKPLKVDIKREATRKILMIHGTLQAPLETTIHPKGNSRDHPIVGPPRGSWKNP